MERPNHKLRQVREYAGLSQKRLAEAIGTTPVNILRWEKGQTVPSLYFRAKLREYFQMSVQELGLVDAPDPLPDEAPVLREPALQSTPDPPLPLSEQQESEGQTESDRLSALQEQKDHPLLLKSSGQTRTFPLSLFKHNKRFAFGSVLAALGIVLLLFGGRMGFLYAQSRHVPPPALNDCRLLAQRTDQLKLAAQSAMTDELRQVEQRLASCTLPTGLWMVDFNGYQGIVTLQLDYRGTLSIAVTFIDGEQSMMTGRWSDSRITFTRHLYSGTIQNYTGTLLSTGSLFSLSGAFTESDHAGHVYQWSAQTNSPPDCTVEENCR